MRDGVRGHHAGTVCYWNNARFWNDFCGGNALLKIHHSRTVRVDVYDAVRKALVTAPGGVFIVLS